MATPSPSPSDAERLAARMEGFGEALFATPPGTTPYLLLDASVDSSIPVFLKTFPEMALCLFEPAAGEDVRDVGPWLAVPEPDGPLWEWYAEHGWGRDWGVAIHSPFTPARLKAQLKTLLRVELEPGAAGAGLPGGSYFFKFYRPRHLRAFLPTFDPRQLGRFMRGIGAWLVEEEGDDATLLEYRMTDSGEDGGGPGLRLTRTSLPGAGAARG